MTEEQAKYLIQILKELGVAFEEGLTENEFNSIEGKFNLQFPPDLRLFLSIALPISPKFINWRKGTTSILEAEDINVRTYWPLEGLVFDIHYNAFWHSSWGAKPNELFEQIKVVQSHYLIYPKLIPIYSHRYIPSSPSEQGNPVFSVYGTDIICYGTDFASYLANEFNFELPKELFDTPIEAKKIEFWSKFTEY